MTGAVHNDCETAAPPEPHEHPPPSEWVRIDAGHVGQAVSIRVGRRGSAYRVVGIAIDNGVEVTADLLRRIRLTELLSYYLCDDDDEWDREVAMPASPRRGVRPDDNALRRFAHAYLRAQRTHPRSAMTAVTRRGGPMPMARSTGYRWLEWCRDKGFLIEEEAQ